MKHMLQLMSTIFSQSLQNRIYSINFTFLLIDVVLAHHFRKEFLLGQTEVCCVMLTSDAFGIALPPIH